MPCVGHRASILVDSEVSRSLPAGDAARHHAIDIELKDVRPTANVAGGSGVAPRKAALLRVALLRDRIAL